MLLKGSSGGAEAFGSRKNVSSGLWNASVGATNVDRDGAAIFASKSVVSASDSSKNGEGYGSGCADGENCATGGPQYGICDRSREGKSCVCAIVVLVLLSAAAGNHRLFDAGNGSKGSRASNCGLSAGKPPLEPGG